MQNSGRDLRDSACAGLVNLRTQSPRRPAFHLRTSLAGGASDRCDRLGGSIGTGGVTTVGGSYLGSGTYRVEKYIYFQTSSASSSSPSDRYRGSVDLPLRRKRNELRRTPTADLYPKKLGLLSMNKRGWKSCLKGKRTIGAPPKGL